MVGPAHDVSFIQRVRMLLDGTRAVRIPARILEFLVWVVCFLTLMNY